MERDYRCISIIRYIVISTHTLTWSVTTLVGSFPEPNINFNSHAHVERD